jgi:2-polyprenyl-6-methoxyphenol hydroxylase-like FAD-dependent oxidoreductase
VTSLEHVADGVAVTLSGGGRREVDLLVGADGIRSGLRRLLGDPGAPRPVGQLSWRFVAEDLPGVRAWTALLGGGRTFLLVPIGAGRVYCYADVSTDGAATGAVAVGPAAGPDRLRELFADFAGPVPAALDRVGGSSALHVAPIEEIVVARPAVGRVVLIGDAAHATSPNLAQGAVMACEDGLVLADELSRGRPVPAALSAFTSRRAPRTRWVRRRTHRRDRTRALPGPARAALLRLAGNRIYRADYRSLLDEP